MTTRESGPERAVSQPDSAAVFVSAMCGLAVAFGVGAAVATGCGVAHAQTGETGSAAGSSGSANSSSSGPTSRPSETVGASTTPAHRFHETSADPKSEPSVSDTNTSAVTKRSVKSRPPSETNSAVKQSDHPPTVQKQTFVNEGQSAVADSAGPVGVRLAATAAAPSQSTSPVAQVSSPAPVATVSIAMAGLDSPATNGPLAPVQEPAAWALLGWARRELAGTPLNGEGAATGSAQEAVSRTVTETTASTTEAASAAISTPQFNVITYALNGMPLGVAASPDGSRVYLTIPTGLNVFNTQTKTVTTVGIGTDGRPRGVAVTPNSGRVYVTVPASNAVSVIDTATNTPVGAPIPVGRDPRNVAISPDGSRAYTVNENSHTVTVIDTATGKVIGKPINVGSRPTAVAVSPDGSRLFVANSNGVNVINTATGEVISRVRITPGQGAVALAVSPDGSRIYVASHSGLGRFVGGHGELTVIDANTNEVLSQIRLPADATGVAVSPDGSLVYVAATNRLQGKNFANSVQVIDAKTNTVVATVKLATSVHASDNSVAVGPDGTVYVGVEKDLQLAVISPVPATETV